VIVLKLYHPLIPPLCVGNDLLHFVPCFKYLGHMIMSNNFDDADIQREITSRPRLCLSVQTR